MDSLKKRVLERDRLHNSPRQMDATTRASETKRICLDCRRSPTLEQLVDWWLEKHPPTHPDDLTEWATAEVLSLMPEMAELSACIFCGGKLIEVTW